jgi:hypothetical protein
MLMRSAKVAFLELSFCHGIMRAPVQARRKGSEGTLSQSDELIALYLSIMIYA